MNTGFDLEVLEYELNALKVEDFDLELTGFDEAEIEKILNKDLSNPENYEDKNKEIDLEDDEYTEFAHCCPKCGFEFN